MEDPKKQAEEPGIPDWEERFRNNKYLIVRVTYWIGRSIGFVFIAIASFIVWLMSILLL